MKIMSVYLVQIIFLALIVMESDGDNLAVDFQNRHLMHDSCTQVLKLSRWVRDDIAAGLLHRHSALVACMRRHQTPLRPLPFEIYQFLVLVPS